MATHESPCVAIPKRFLAVATYLSWGVEGEVVSLSRA